MSAIIYFFFLQVKFIEHTPSVYKTLGPGRPPASVLKWEIPDSGHLLCFIIYIPFP